jgi:hypothetical protein
MKGTAAVVSTLLVLTAGCGTRTVKTPIVDNPSLQVTLRHQLRSGVVVERGFQHPVTISQQRLGHILGAVDIEQREEGKKRIRLAAIHPELITPVARALVEAFEAADSNQEVAVIAIRKQHRLGIFHKKFLTTLTAFFRDDRLYLHLSRVEWEIPKEREDRVMPEPERSEKQMAFRTVPTRKMTQAGSQGVAVRWRDSLFSAPVRTASDERPRDERTILMESPIPASELDGDLSGIDIEGIEPDVLRALADLEEARRSGSITESEYQQRRENLLGQDAY